MTERTTGPASGPAGALAGRVAIVTGAGDGIGPVAVFLASDGARYLTGNTLSADGGSHIDGVAWTPDLDGEG